MARTFICGFQCRDPYVRTNFAAAVHGAEGGSIGNATACSLDTAIFRSGDTSLKIVAQSGVNSYFQHASLGGFRRVYIRVTQLPTTTPRVLLGATTNINSPNVRLNPNGTLDFYLGAATFVGTSTTALDDPSRWYMVETRNLAGTSVSVLRIDGSDEVFASPSSWGLMTFCGAFDVVADTYTAYFADLVVDDAGFPGPGNTALLLPISDASNLNWRNGNNSGTTNLFQIVSSRPPAGVGTAVETATSNIECASTSASSEYVATMQTYASAGIGASDTINALRLICEHGEDIATGTKTGVLSLTQNPAIAGMALGIATAPGYGEDSGTHGNYSDAAAAWVNSVSGGVSSWVHARSPSVDVNVNPLMSVTKTDATTRIACVCFMGIYVDYTPAPAAPGPLPPFLGLRLNQAVNRAAYW